MIPVITIDGPSGSGKGTLSHRLATHLKWHFLDSGLIYRVFALAVIKAETDQTDETALADLASTIEINLDKVTDDLRTEHCGNTASKVSKFPKVRAALLQRQRQFRQSPGLVTDGRDMGTVVFPDATLKIFLTASVEERAQRRYQQLLNQGKPVDLEQVRQLIAERDKRDAERSISPTKPADDAIVFDTTCLSISKVFKQVLEFIEKLEGT